MFGDQWYEAELARSGRSKCKEFRCKQNIDEGELRIGIKIEENDHSGDTLGWYHPACLWKTFTYKTNGNPRIEKTSDIRNFKTLDEVERKMLSDLIDKNNQSAPPPSPSVGVKHGREDASTSPAALVPVGAVPKGFVSLSFVNSKNLECVGDTFQLKDLFKSVGGYWNGANKCWSFPPSKHDIVMALFQTTLNELETKSTPHLMSVATLLTVDVTDSTASKATGNATSSAKPLITQSKPAFAMCGTIVMSIDKTTQDIRIYGDTNHIAYRLLAATGSHRQVGHYVTFDHWVFPTQSRQGARQFLCMPDALPAAGLDVITDLTELGQKQALTAGVEITPQQQEAANALYTAETQRRDADLVSKARSTLESVGWGVNEGCEGSGGGRPKRAKKNDPPAETPPTPSTTKPFPTTVDELCYELRLDLTHFTIPEFKERLAARGFGLSTSGNRDALVARFILAGVENKPIEHFAEYARLAKARKFMFRGAPPGQECDVIDALLMRCVRK